jgi:homoserine kinase
MKKVARAWAPASLSNLGPGFDALGAAITGLGDTVSVERTARPGITVDFDPLGVWMGPTDARRNTAAVAASHVATVTGFDCSSDGGLHLTIRKGLAAGTGLGSSAASAVAAAVATESLLGCKLSEKDMIAAVLAGESATSGQGHADNVLPSLMGGLVLMRSAHPTDFLRVEGWEELALYIALPDAEVLTRDARKALPATVPLPRAVDHAARLALMVAALERKDVAGLGTWMMSDDIVIPARRHLWPWLDEMTSAALGSGAAGCTVSGSGPAVVACCRQSGNDGPQMSIRKALEQQMERAGLKGSVSMHHIDNHGALLLEGDQAITWRTGIRMPNPKS